MADVGSPMREGNRFDRVDIEGRQRAAGKDTLNSATATSSMDSSCWIFRNARSCNPRGASARASHVDWQLRADTSIEALALSSDETELSVASLADAAFTSTMTFTIWPPATVCYDSRG
jgi:hypothetical protein